MIFFVHDTTYFKMCKEKKHKPKDCYFLKMILFAHDAIKNVHGLKPWRPEPTFKVQLKAMLHAKIFPLRRAGISKYIMPAYVSICFLKHPLLVFFSVVPNPMFPAKKSENRKSLQVLKHRVSNILIFQWRMTSSQSNSKERESEVPFIYCKKRNSRTQANSSKFVFCNASSSSSSISICTKNPLVLGSSSERIPILDHIGAKTHAIKYACKTS